MRNHKTFTRHFLSCGAKIIQKQSFFDFTQPAHNEFCSLDTTFGGVQSIAQIELPSLNFIQFYKAIYAL